MRVMYCTDNEMRLCLAWLREQMMFNPQPEGEMLLEILESASVEERKPVASRRAPNVISLDEWRVGA